MSPRRERRRIVLGFADQALMALANAGNAFLATVVLSRAAAGSVLLVIAVVYAVMGISRALIGEPVLVHVSRYDGEARRVREQDALAAAARVGAVIGLALAIVWALGPTSLGELIWAAPFVPALLLHDAARSACLAARQQGKALTMDAIWVVVQAAILSVAFVAGWREPSTLLASWGLGATVAVVFFTARSQHNPLRGQLRRWIGETRHLSSWLIMTALLGQGQSILVAFLIVELLGVSAFAGLRLIQIAILQPATNAVVAATNLLVPRLSRLAHEGNLVGLRRLTSKVALLGIGLGIGVAVVAIPLGKPALALYKSGAYLDVAPIIVPVSLHAMALLAHAAFIAALRGLHRVQVLFVHYLVLSAASIAGVLVGAQGGSLLGASWGLALGAWAGLVSIIALYGWVIFNQATAKNGCAGA